MKSWFAVQSKPRQEIVAKEQLEQQGYGTYLPLIRRRKQRNRKWIYATEPLFPNYLFIRADPKEQSLAPVRSTVGVARLVRFGELLRPVPPQVIDYLRQSEEVDAGRRVDDTWPFRPGDRVEMLAGALAGLSGIYSMDEPKDRASLLIELLGRVSEVTVNRADLSVGRL
ncbi:MAG: transcriptional activator RfaH [Pseudomonadota bacterium]